MDAVTLDFVIRKLHGYPMDAKVLHLRAGNLQNRSNQGRSIDLIDRGYPMDAVGLDFVAGNLLDRSKIDN